MQNGIIIDSLLRHDSFPEPCRCPH